MQMAFWVLVGILALFSLKGLFFVHKFFLSDEQKALAAELKQ